MGGSITSRGGRTKPGHKSATRDKELSQWEGTIWLYFSESVQNTWGRGRTLAPDSEEFIPRDGEE